jgi:transposase
LIEPLLPLVNSGGRPEKHPCRAIVDAILYVVRAGVRARSPVRPSAMSRWSRPAPLFMIELSARAR